MRERLLTPALVTRFAVGLHKELVNAQTALRADRGRIEVKHMETRDSIARLVRRLEHEEDAPSALIERLKTLEVEECRHVTQLLATPIHAVVRVPSNYEHHYKRAISMLNAQLASADGAAAREAIRGLIDKVVVYPGTARGGGSRQYSSTAIGSDCWRSPSRRR